MRILTINAEDWYNGYISPQDRDWGRFEYRVEKWLIPMLDELDRRKIKAVVFCTGWLADHHPDIIRETHHATGQFLPSLHRVCGSVLLLTRRRAKTEQPLS